MPPISDSDHVRGSLGAPLIVVHYGDFQCPFSGLLHRALQDAHNRFAEQFGLIFRHYPLDDVHPKALAASLAAEAAGSQFWAMHDALFENQQALENEIWLQIAANLKIENFPQKMAAPEVSGAVSSQKSSSKSAGVHGTPTLFINGVFHDNRERLWEASKLMPLLEAALTEKGA